MTRCRKTRRSGDTSPLETALGLLLMSIGVALACAFSYFSYLDYMAPYMG